MFAGGLTEASFLPRLTAPANCLLTRRRSCLAVGMLAFLRLTTTWPSMPGWMSQKYVYLPFFGNLTRIGLGLCSRGRPEPTRLLPR